MRVNLGLEMPIASLTLTDTGAEATAVYLAHNLPEPRYDEALAQLMKTQGVQHMTWRPGDRLQAVQRSEEQTSELQSLMRISYAVFCLKKKKKQKHTTNTKQTTAKNYIQTSL